MSIRRERDSRRQPKIDNTGGGAFSGAWAQTPIHGTFNVNGQQTSGSKTDFANAWGSDAGFDEHVESLWKN